MSNQSNQIKETRGRKPVGDSKRVRIQNCLIEQSTAAAHKRWGAAAGGVGRMHDQLVTFGVLNGFEPTSKSEFE